MSKKKELEKKRQEMQEEMQRIRLPRGREVLGVLQQRLGSSRTMIKCLDGKARICRIPGRLKRRLWVREGDIVVVEPWEYDNTKGDIVFKYRPSQIFVLRKKGLLDKIEDSEEF